MGTMTDNLLDRVLDRLGHGCGPIMCGDCAELAMDIQRQRKIATPSVPLLTQAANRLSAKYGTLEVAAFRGDENYATVMLRDGRWARYVHGEGWTPLPPLVASTFPCPCTGEIGPCPRCAEGAVDA